jgi:hypothetical protein
VSRHCAAYCQQTIFPETPPREVPEGFRLEKFLTELRTGERKSLRAKAERDNTGLAVFVAILECVRLSSLGRRLQATAQIRVVVSELSADHDCDADRTIASYSRKEPGVRPVAARNAFVK